MTSPGDHPRGPDLPRDPLTDAGWSPRVDALATTARAELARPDLVLGRVAQSGVTHALVVTGAGWITATAEISEDDIDIALVPTTGDWVLLDPSYEPPVIATILPRWSILTRGDALGRGEQVLAADVDLVLIVLGLDRPRKVGRVERALALAWDSGAQPVLVLTKADLMTPVEAHGAVEELTAIARDVDVIVTAAGSNQGVDEVQRLLRPNHTAVLIGESGAGKSTLVNALVGNEVQATGDVREGDSKGRHTTSTRDLVPLPGGGVLIDTPGIRGVALWDASDGVAKVFDDLEALADSCRFPNCEHETEPGCAILGAIASGQVARARVDRWLVYIAELDAQDERQVARERAAEAAASVRSKAKARRARPDTPPSGRQKHRPR